MQKVGLAVGLAVGLGQRPPTRGMGCDPSLLEHPTPCQWQYGRDSQRDWHVKPQ